MIKRHPKRLVGGWLSISCLGYSSIAASLRPLGKAAARAQTVRIFLTIIHTVWNIVPRRFALLSMYE